MGVGVGALAPSPGQVAGIGRVRVRVRVRVGGGMRYLRTEKLRSFHLRPFIVLTITKRAHYKAERETTCSVNVLKLVSPNQPDLQQLFRARVRG